MSEGSPIFHDIKEQDTKDRQVCCSLGEVANQFLNEKVSPAHAGYSSVAEAWQQLLPRQLLEHCEIADIKGGQLTVKVDSPSYKYELHLCSNELLQELQLQCSNVRLKKIKFILA